MPGVRAVLSRLLVAVAIVDTALAVALVVAFLPPPPRTSPGQAPPNSPEHRLGMDHRDTVPSHPPGTLFDAVEGTYYQGDHLGLNWGLDLRADGTYSFRWSGCLGEYEKDSGTFHFQGGRLVPSSSRPGAAKWLRRAPAGFHAIRWGDRMYLIQPEELADFRMSVRQGWEPRAEDRGLFFLRRRDWEKAAPGFPPLPPFPGVAAADQPKLDAVAGEFHMVDRAGFKRGVELKPDGHYSSRIWSSRDDYRVVEGTFRFEGDQVVFTASKPAAVQDLREPARLVPVRWGHRLYLIAGGELAAFRRDVVSGDEPRMRRSGPYMLRDPDWRELPGSPPELPGQPRITADEVRGGASWLPVAPDPPEPE